MRTILQDDLDREYGSFLWRLRGALLDKFGTQRNVCTALGVDPSNLSKFLSGTIDCNSRLFFELLYLAGFQIVSK